MQRVGLRLVGAVGIVATLALLLAAHKPPADPVADYTLALSPVTLTASLAGSATTTLLLSSWNGFAGTLKLDLLDSSGHPAYGVTLSPNSVTLTAGQSAAVPVRVTIAPSVPVGTFSFTLRASGGGVVHASPMTLVVSGAAAGSSSLGSAVNYGVGTAPDSVAVADFNGDGKSDLAVANGSSGNVSVLLGNGDGTFQAQRTYYGVGSGPRSVAVGDFNGDDKLDLAVANFKDGTVSVLLGNGDGTFQPQVTYSAGTLPSALAVADFNGDGKPDLAVANATRTGTVSVLLGNGDGTFASAFAYAVGSVPTALAVADFNGDGKPDLAVANGGDSTVSVLLGNGDGTFQPQKAYNVSQPFSVAVGDFNGDGALDLALTNIVGTVSVLLGNGHGAFQAQPTHYGAGSYGAGAGPGSVAVGDFNNDGKLDLAVTDTGSNEVSVFLGNGNGSFAVSTAYSTGNGPDSVAVADVNGDGRPDLVVANNGSSNVSVLLGQ